MPRPQSFPSPTSDCPDPLAVPLVPPVSRPSSSGAQRTLRLPLPVWRALRAPHPDLPPPRIMEGTRGHLVHLACPLSAPRLKVDARLTSTRSLPPTPQARPHLTLSARRRSGRRSGLPPLCACAGVPAHPPRRRPGVHVGPGLQRAALRRIAGDCSAGKSEARSSPVCSSSPTSSQNNPQRGKSNSNLPLFPGWYLPAQEFWRDRRHILVRRRGVAALGPRPDPASRSRVGLRRASGGLGSCGSGGSRRRCVAWPAGCSVIAVSSHRRGWRASA